jgi:hypothetical protein
MLAGVFRFVCHNGLVCGDTIGDIRIPHKGDVVGRVIEGAYSVLQNFDRINEQRETMQATILEDGEQKAFARAALALKYNEENEEKAPAPITKTQLLMPRRFEDKNADLWSVFNRVQENLIRGGLWSRLTNGLRIRTRAVTSIHQDIKLNRSLWILASEMGQLKA